MASFIEGKGNLAVYGMTLLSPMVSVIWMGGRFMRVNEGLWSVC